MEYTGKHDKNSSAAKEIATDSKDNMQDIRANEKSREKLPVMVKIAVGFTALLVVLLLTAVLFAHSKLRTINYVTSTAPVISTEASAEGAESADAEAEDSGAVSDTLLNAGAQNETGSMSDSTAEEHAVSAGASSEDAKSAAGADSAFLNTILTAGIKEEAGTSDNSAEEVAAQSMAGGSDTASTETVMSTDGLEVRESGAPIPSGEYQENKNIINIMVIGTDMRLVNTDDKGRADMTMLVSVNTEKKTVNLISFERALGMPVSGKKDVLLNSLMNEGGPELIVEDISKCFLVGIEGFVHIDYDAFVQAVDAIGGIDLEFDQAEANHFNARITLDPRSSFAAVPGDNHLGGYEALIYCRLRDSDDNWGRQARTRSVMTAIMKKAQTLSIKQLNNLVDTVLPLISTDLTELRIAKLLLDVPSMLKYDVRGLSIPDKSDLWVYMGEDGGAVYGCDFEQEAKRLSEFING